jgi:archaeal flagellar protein FlaJ
MFKIPYSLLPPKSLRKNSAVFLGVAENISSMFKFLDINLKQADIDLSTKEYLSMCLMACLVFFIFIGSLLSFILYLASVNNPFLFSIVVSLFVTFTIFLQQISYPKIFVSKRVKNIERNLLGALQNILIQLNSGIPLFNILVNISKGNYGEISKEFSRLVKDINTGRPQIEALEEMAAINPSLFFRRTIWQIANGMKSGADMSSVIQEIINLLSEEQILQIQKYGSQLNPLAMFYMLMVVIAPSLGITFLVMIVSFIALPEGIVKLVFWGLYSIVVFFQLMFAGLIKSKRPNLLGNK